MIPLSGLDASFLYLETPSAPLHVCTLVVCDPSTAPNGFSFQKLYSFIERRVAQIPIFRQRLVEMPLRLYYPVWVEDPDFDLVHHLRHAVVPAPGGPKELGELAGRLMQGTLDRRYPLWEMHMIEGLEGGKIAIACKIHHAVVDGVTGAGLMAQLFDLQALDVDESPVAMPVGEPIPSDAELIKFALKSMLKQPQKVANIVKKTLVNRREMIRVRANLMAERYRTGVQTKEIKHTAPRTPLNGHIGPRRNLAMARVPLSTIKEIKNATQTTVNDVVLALCGAVVRQYLIRHDALPQMSLTAALPVSVHGQASSADAGTNSVSAMRSTLATHLADPLERLQLIHKDTCLAKEGLNAVGANLLQEWAEVISPHAFNLGTRLFTEAHLSDIGLVQNLIISNVPGPRFPLYIAGMKIEELYPIGPVFESSGLNITLFSYVDSVDFGFAVDRDMIPDAWDMAEDLQIALQELANAVLA